MKQQTFVGPLIHNNNNGDLILFDEAAVIVKDGEVSDDNFLI